MESLIVKFKFSNVQKENSDENFSGRENFGGEYFLSPVKKSLWRKKFSVYFFACSIAIFCKMPSVSLKSGKENEN